MSVKIFLCYSSNDERLVNQFKIHMMPLKRQGLIDRYDRNINAGTEWEQEIDTHLNEANIILLFISPDFMNSDYAYGIEMQRAVERDQRGEAHVFLIILRPTDWQGAPFAKLRVMPQNSSRPITRWSNRDQVFDDIVTEISNLAKSITRKADPGIDREKLDENPSPPIHKTASEEGSRQLNEEPPQAQVVNSGSSKWVLGRILIIVLTFLWVLGAIFNGLSFLASIILPIISGLVLLVGYDTLYATKHPSKTGGEVSLINVARDLWKNRKISIISILLLFILIAGGIGIYNFQHKATGSPIPNTTYTGSLVLQDSLTTNEPPNNSNSRPWINFTSQHGFCKFTASGYLVSTSANTKQNCIALGSDYSDFAMKIEMTILKGSGDGDVGGIFFRADSQAPQSYIFYISAFDARALEAVASDNSGRSLIHDGRYVSDVTNQTFVIEIIARGENIKVCVNNQCYNEFPDGAYSHGAIGLFAQSDQGQTEVQFNDVEVWTL